MKKKSIAALMAVVMTLTGTFSGTVPAMASGLFSDGSVQSTEAGNDVSLEDGEQFSSETAVLEFSDGVTDIQSDGDEEAFLSEIVPFEDFSAGNVEQTDNTVAASGTCGPNLTWTLTGNTLIISGTGEMDSYTGWGPWRDYKDNIEKIELREGVTSIGGRAFRSLIALKEATLPESLRKIGGSAFEDCINLKKIELPSEITELPQNIFQGCTSLEEVKLPENLQFIRDKTFNRCYSLKKVNFPSALTSIGYEAFQYCYALQDFVMPQNVVNISQSFKQCKSLRHVAMSPAMTSIPNDAFWYSTELRSIELYNGILSIGPGAFAGCRKLQDIYFHGSEQEWNAIKIGGDNGNLGNATVHCLSSDMVPISSCSIRLPDEVYVSNGEEIRPQVTVTASDKILQEGTDYSINYENNIDPGTGSVIITGLGNYYGAVTLMFQIYPENSIVFCQITGPEEALSYTGEELKPSVKVVGDYGRGNVLIQEKDYTLTYENNIRPGKATVKVTGCGDYTGEAETSFIILPRKVEQLQTESHVGWADVRWAAREEADGYEVRYYPDGSLEDLQILDIPVTDSSSESVRAKLENLERGRNYVIEVAAYARGRDGEEVPYYSEETVTEISIPNLPLIGDCWGFTNPGIIFGAAQYYERYLSKAQAEEYYTNVLDFVNVKKGLGVCFGMCLTVINSWFSDSPDCEELGVNRLSEVSSMSSHSTVKDVVIYAQAFEAYSNIHGFGGIKPTGTFNSLLVAVNAYVEGYNPVILKLSKRNEEGEQIEGHSVLALDYEIESEEQAKIKIYDPNWPGQERYIYFRGNAGNYVSWEYDTGGGIWGTVSGNGDENQDNLELGHIYYTLSGTITVGDSEFSMVGSQVTSNLNLVVPRVPDEEGSLLFVDTQSDNVESDPGAWLENTSLIELEPSGDSGSAEPGMKAYWLKGMGPYKFRNVPSGVKITIASGDHAVTAVAEESCDLTILAGDSTEYTVQVLSGSTSSVEASFSTYSGTEKKVITFTGTTQSGFPLKIVQSDTAVKLTGLTGLKVNQQTLNKSDDKYIPADEEKELSASDLHGEMEYILGENISGDGSTALMEDSDGDGRGDTVVSVVQRQVDLSLCTFTLSGTSFTYNGSEQKPAVTVKDSRETFVPGVDYTVSYENNVNPGTAIVTVTGKGRVHGTLSGNFAIEPAPLSRCNFSLSFSSCTYSGAAQRPGVTLKLGSSVLRNGTDYTVSYSNNINAGTAAVTVTGKGNYSGTVKKNFTINKASLSGCAVSLSANRYYYNGKAFKPGVTVKKGSTVLRNGTHYTVSYSGNINIGTARVTIVGKGNYSGTIRKNYTITTAVGRTYTVGALKYKITRVAANGTGTVAVTAPKSRYYTGITIPATVKIGGVSFKVTSIYLKAFRNCKKLKKVVVGNNVTTICHYAFQGCTNLQYIMLGSRVQVIGKYAFYGDKALKGITIKSRYIRTVGARAFRGIHSRAVIKVPRLKYAAYKRLFNGKGLSSRVSYRRY